MLNRGLDKLELLRIVEAVANEKSIDKDIVIGSMESAIQKAALTKFGHNNEILVKIDRASMAYSLETRAPFLDKNVVETAWRIPTEMKVNRGSGKLILKKLLCKYLPSEYVYKPKKGFGIPIQDWLRGPLKEWSEDLLFGHQTIEQNYFEIDNIRKLWTDHINKGIDNSRILWPILMLETWLNHNK